jgi:uncharacterized membrane protein YgcG
VAAALGLGATAALADGWGQRVPGQHVYDMAGALTAAQVSDLERSAAAVEQAGSPTVVYLRRKVADDFTARLDASALMQAWGVESSPGANDGFVVLLDVPPAGARFAAVGLVAGDSRSALLDQALLQRVLDGTMKPRLADGDVAGALSGALTHVAGELGAPLPAVTPPPQERPSLDAIALGLLACGVTATLSLAILVPALRERFRR